MHKCQIRCEIYLENQIIKSYCHIRNNAKALQINMEETLRFIVESLVENKDKIKIRQEEKGDNNLLLTLEIADEDMGTIIGKEGKTIRAIRTLLAVRAAKEKKHLYLELAE